VLSGSFSPDNEGQQGGNDGYETRGKQREAGPCVNVPVGEDDQ
jgi:hypothetical protein